MKSNIYYHFFMAIFGLLMGAIMVYTGFSNFDEVHKMFTFADFRLLFGFAGAVTLLVIAFLLLNRRKSRRKTRINKGAIPGGIMFGTGWAITGACPTIALVQLGQGQIAALFTVFGILFGVWLYRYISAGNIKLDTEICGEE